LAEGGHEIVTISGVVVAIGLAGVLLAGEAGAQSARGVAVEGLGGWAGYLDDATIEHRLVGASVRIPLLDRLSVGPEVVYSLGPDPQRNVSLVGAVWFDVVRTTPTTRVVPYLVVGGGFQRQRDVVSYVSGEGAFTAGGGARVHVNERVYVGADVRVGWEPHLRTAAHVGVTWPRR
jgi:hypothetical protein